MSNAPHPSDLESSHPRRGGGPALRVLSGGPGTGARTLPHSPEAEEHLISCCLIDARDVVGRCLAMHMREDWFYDARYGTMFGALVALYRAGQAIDVAVLAEHLRAQRQLDAVGGFPMLVQVSGRMSTTAQAMYFAGVVRDLAAMRAVVRNGTKLVEETHALTGGGEELGRKLEEHQAWIGRTLDMLRSDQRTIAEAAQAAYQRTLDKLAGKPDRSRWLFTGLSDYDEKFGPFDANNEDWLVVIGAFQGGAKSSFMRGLLLHNLRAGRTAQVFLLETGVGMLLELLACTASAVPSHSLSRLPNDLAARYRAALEEMHGYLGKSLFVVDEVIPVETLIARVDDHVRRHGAPDGVYIDHMHLLNSATMKGGKREAEMGYIAKQLARCGKRHNRTIFALAQLNRSARADGKNIRPEPHHLRDSGEIEQAARRIVLLHTPDSDIRGVEQTKNQDQVMMEVHNAKHNNGSVGWREVWFRRSITRFSDMGRSDGQPTTPARPAPAPAAAMSVEERRRALAAKKAGGRSMAEASLAQQLGAED